MNKLLPLLRSREKDWDLKDKVASIITKFIPSLYIIT